MSRNHVTRKTKAWGAVQIVTASCYGVFGCSSEPASDCTSNATCPPADATTDSAWEGGGQDAKSDSDIDSGVRDESDAPSPGDGSSDSAVDAFDGFTCDPSESPHDAPCVIDEAYGVFVAASANGGSDSSGDGTKGRPYATIGHGVAGLAGRSRIYICNGSYAESVLLASSASLFGGLACPHSDAGAAWTYVGGRAEVASPSSDYALRVDAVGSPIAFEDFGFTSPNASGQDLSGNGKSSIAALINSSTVTFRRCALTAGGGDKGNDGTTGSNYPAGQGTGPDGNANDGGAGGNGGSIACSDGTSSTGGKGGEGAMVIGAAGADGGATPLPLTMPGYDGVGGPGGRTNCIPGDPGANGATGEGGVEATSYGMLSANGWTPIGGGDGRAGHPGQGGGGGGGKATPLLGGTGGGAGGCGGAGGRGGKGGGASLALACIASTVTLEQCTLIAASAGNGGKGGDGQSGQGGGLAGAVGPLGNCGGGIGGNGAGGAGGAGGTGGISVCVVYRGSAPVGSPNCVTGDAGAPGGGGSGKDGGSNALGSGPSGNSGANGLAGMAQPVWQVQ